jgi:hypothetical protein
MVRAELAARATGEKSQKDVCRDCLPHNDVTLEFDRKPQPASQCAPRLFQDAAERQAT